MQIPVFTCNEAQLNEGFLANHLANFDTMDSLPKPAKFVPHLDDILTPEECAAWLRISERDLRLKSQGFRAPIPAYRPGKKLTRYPPRMVLAKMAEDSGVKLTTIAASYGMEIRGGV